MQAPVPKSAIIAVLCTLAGLFSSGCGQRGALYLPVIPALDSRPIPSEPKESQVVPPGLKAVEGTLSPEQSPLEAYSTSTPGVDVMEAPIFFETLPTRAPASDSSAPPAASPL